MSVTVSTRTEAELCDELRELEEGLNMSVERAIEIEPLGALSPAEYAKLARLKNVLWR